MYINLKISLFKIFTLELIVSSNKGKEPKNEEVINKSDSTSK